MTLDQIRYFLELAYCKSFSKAAQNLYISQPNLTKYIAAMEKELGAKLFQRTTRHVELTEYGEQLLNRAENLFVPFLQSYEDLQSDIGSRRRAIYIGVSRDEELPGGLLEPILRQNLGGKPVRFVMTCDSPLNLNTGLQSHQYHMIVSSDRNARSLVDTRHRKLRPVHMLLAVSRGHPLADKPGLSPADLREDTIFMPMPKDLVPSAELTKTLYRRFGTLLNIKLLDSPADVLACARVGAGAAIVPDVVDTGRYPDIRFFPFRDNRTDSAWQSLVWRSDETDPFALELIGEITNRFPEQAAPETEF